MVSFRTLWPSAGLSVSSEAGLARQTACRIMTDSVFSG